MTPALAMSLLALAAVLLAATSPWSEMAVAVPIALVLVGTGLLSAQEAIAEVHSLLPVVGFLAAILVLARLCDDEGLFRAAGGWMAQASAGRPRSLLSRVFVTAAATTAVLSLDATVVLLTPVVLETARAMRVPARPHAYAAVHLSNSASLLLPVSNLTNLLAFAATGLSFAGFSALMAAPWLAAIAMEYVLFRWAFRRDLVDCSEDHPEPTARPIPIFVVAVLVLTLGGFIATSLCGLSPAWAALIGAAVIGARSVRSGHSTVAGLVRSAHLPFLAFVLALGVVVQAAMVNGLDDAVRRILPTGAGLVSLLTIAALAALLSNIANNLPAILVLIPLLSGAGPLPVLAALIGVNVGPNLTYIGSLANLLWRRVLHRRGEPTSVREFTWLGVLTVPACLTVAVLALWAASKVVGL